MFHSLVKKQECNSVNQKKFSFSESKFLALLKKTLKKSHLHIIFVVYGPVYNRELFSGPAEWKNK